MENELEKIWKKIYEISERIAKLFINISKKIAKFSWKMNKKSYEIAEERMKELEKDERRRKK